MVLDIKGLHVEYYNRQKSVYAVDDVSLSIQKGQALGIVGESGSGKTTLANAVLRLLPEHSTKIEGQINFLGQSILDLSTKAFNQMRWKDLSVVFQKSMNAFSPIHKIGEQIEDIYRIHEPKAARDQIKEVTNRLFGLVNLSSHIYNMYPHELSGGMMQRVAIAVSLLHQPSLIIMDEATTALDVVTQGQILREIRKLESDFNMTRMMITHDMSVVATICDRIAVMYAGRLMEIGQVREVIERPRHPYTKGLVDSYPALRAPKEDLKAIPGSLPSLSERISGCIFAARCPKRQPKCLEARPPLTQIGIEHEVSCYYPEEY